MAVAQIGVITQLAAGTGITAAQLNTNYDDIKTAFNNLVTGADTLAGDIFIDGHLTINSAGLDILFTATENDDHALEIDVIVGGFGDIKALDIDYITGNLSAGEDEAIILINVDESAAGGGDIAALEILATEGSASMHGMFAGVGVAPIRHQSGTFGDMDVALVNATDRLTEFTSTGSDIQMFVANGDTVTIGSASKFEEIEFLLAIAAGSAGIKPQFDFSTGPGAWTEFSPVDGTNGMKNSGIIAWDDGDIPTWAKSGSEFLIRITRERTTVTSPTEDLVQIAAVTTFSWDNDGNVTVNSLLGLGGLLPLGSGSEDVRVGDGNAIATTAVTGFLLLPGCAGPPTGDPTNDGAGAVALVADTTNNVLYINDGGGWVPVGGWN